MCTDIQLLKQKARIYEDNIQNILLCHTVKYIYYKIYVEQIQKQR